MKKEIKITGIVEATSELKYNCESCGTTFWIGESLIDNNIVIVSPCKCYQCLNQEADNIMENYNGPSEFDESFEFEDIA